MREISHKKAQKTQKSQITFCVFCAFLWLQITPPLPKLVKIKDDLYQFENSDVTPEALRYWGGNITALITNEGVLLVDAKYARAHDDVMSKVKSLTGKPIRYGVLTQMPPIVNYGDGGNWTDWTKSIDEILKMDFDIAIPGHGPAVSKARVAEIRNKFMAIQQRVRTLNREKKTEQEVASTLLKEFNWAPPTTFQE